MSLDRCYTSLSYFFFKQQHSGPVSCPDLRFFTLSHGIDLLMIGLLYRTIPHECRLNLHPAESKALPCEGAWAPGESHAICSITR